MEQPVGHQYDGSAYDPNPVLLALSSRPPQPVLPRQQVSCRSSSLKTRRERIPLTSSLTGPGRAGTETTLLGSHGSKYCGQVLSGRPHGSGQYWAQGIHPGQPLQLVYEGQFLRGVRHGQGTAYFHSRGEVYSGQWVDGRRTGRGKLTYTDGSVYEGMWSKDVRDGVGTLSSANGTIFVGTFLADKRQGLGVIYWVGRCQKLVAEYVDDCPTCGVMMDLADNSAEAEAPITQQLRDAIAAARVKAIGASAADSAAPTTSCLELPGLQLVQPNQVLSREFAAVRRSRGKQQQLEGQPGHRLPAAVEAAIDPVTATLAANTMSLLRHAFILIAGGDDTAAHVLPHQLQELVVLAGLDPAASAVLKLLGLLHQRIEVRGTSKLFLDDLLHVANFFRAQPLAVTLQLQQQAVDQQAAAVEAEAAAEEVKAEAAAATAAEAAAEAWQEEEEEEEEAADAGDGGPWGAACEQDMLAQHIALHRPAA